MSTRGSGAAAAFFESSTLSSRAHRAPKIRSNSTGGGSSNSSSGSSSNGSSRGSVWAIVWGLCFAFGVIMGSTTNANRVVIPVGSAAAAPPAEPELPVGSAAAAPPAEPELPAGSAVAAPPAEPKPTPMLRGSKHSTTNTTHGRNEDSAGAPMLRGSKHSTTSTTHGRNEDSAGGTRRKKPFLRRRGSTLNSATSAQHEAGTVRHTEGAETEQNGEPKSLASAMMPTNDKDNNRQNSEEKTTKSTDITIVTGGRTPRALASAGGSADGTTNTSRMVSRMWRLNEGEWGPNEGEGTEIVAELAKPRVTA